MRANGHTTGTLGVYLVAAELSRLGFIVSPTSRGAAGADLLVTDVECKKAWSVQVKTNRRPAPFWLMGALTLQLKSNSHVYVFVNVPGNERLEYIVVPSNHVADKVRRTKASTGSVWYDFRRDNRLYEDTEGWEVFG